MTRPSPSERPVSTAVWDIHSLKGRSPVVVLGHRFSKDTVSHPVFTHPGFTFYRLSPVCIASI